jgi:5-methylcytosine-specific restriction endonuclease McrA
MAHIETLHAHRGTKPRTYHLRHRDKHGSAADVAWRKAVFARDNYTCQNCGAKKCRIQAHHVKAYKAHPELRHELSNGVTLCIPCHKQTDTFGWQNYWRNEIAAKRLSQEVFDFTAG